MYKQQDQSPEIVDVLIIGSGLSGSIVARSLAETNQKVIVLERGPWRDTLPVRSFQQINQIKLGKLAPLPLGWKTLTYLLRGIKWRNKNFRFNRRGMYEYLSHPNLSVLTTSTIGGCSTIWGGLITAPQNPKYWHNLHPQLDPEAIEKFYPEIRAELGAIDLTDDLAIHQTVSDHLQTINQNISSEKISVANYQPQIAYAIAKNLSDEGKINSNEFGIQRKNIEFNGDSFFGSANGGRASADFIYLMPAIKISNGRVEVRSESEVYKITRQKESSGYLVFYREGNNEKIIKARKVVLACGTMNTIKLLCENSSSTNGEQSLNTMPALGKSFGGNGDVIGLWQRKKFPEKNGEMLNSFKALPCFGAVAIPGSSSPLFALASMTGFEQLPFLPKFIKYYLKKIIILIGMGVDSNNGQAIFKDNRWQINYQLKNETIFTEIDQGFKKLAKISGEKTCTIPLHFTTHQWGGACIGTSVENGVVNHNGEVYANPNLYVVDASALPAATGYPPSLAIAGWAKHVAAYLIKSNN